jgi:CubicO group peptidase (beta-lactamase class C family)/beta-glucosidase-like glycosyl hydrolase
MTKNVFAIGLLSLIGLSSLSSKAQSISTNPLITADATQQKKWVDSVYESLSWNERIAQLFMVPAYSKGDAKHHKKLLQLVKMNKVGGLIFMPGGPMQQAKLSNQLQSSANIPLLIGMDLEWGLNMRLDSTLRYPNQLTLGAISDDTLICQMSTDIAQKMQIMGVHLHIPAQDTLGEIPTSLSKKAIAELLKKNMAFQGLVITDALNMDGVIQTTTPGKLEVAALLAGNDLLLYPQNVPLALKEIRKSLRRRQLKRDRLELSVRKILLAKYKVGLSSNQTVNTDNLHLKLNQPASEVLLQKLYQNAITLVKNENNLLPFHLIDTTSYASLSLNDRAPLFHRNLGKYANFNAFNNLGNKNSEVLISKLKNFEVVVIGVFGTNNSPSKQFGVKSEDIDLITKLSKYTKVVVTVFGNPYSLSQFDKFEHVVCAYENNEITQALVPQALFGAFDIEGRLSVSIENSFKQGSGISLKNIARLGMSSPEFAKMDSRVLNKIDLIANEAITSMATPGCQILVAKNGKIVFDKSYGYHTYDSLRPVTSESIYDIASITKVAASLQAVTFMEEQGLIDLDKKISVYLTDLKGSNKEHMTIRDILTHQSGLWPYLPFWKQTMNSEEHLPEYFNHKEENEFPHFVSEGLYTSESIRESVWEWVIESKVRDKEENVSYGYKYSDMGYYMIHRLAEEVLNQPLEDFLTQNLYEPLGLTTLGYNPLDRFSKNRITPTEKDSTFRMSQIWGTVHDQGAALFGGVAGHAGLFSNSRDLAILMQMHLQGGSYGGQKYYDKSTLNKFTPQQFDNYNRRGVGWDKPLPGAWYGPTSEYASSETFGHTGFTGTAVWADPTFDLVFVFLSNRIYPNANNRKLIQNNIRTRIQDLVYQSIWEYSKYN